MTMDQISGLTFFAFAAAIGFQGWVAARAQKAQAAWPVVEGIVAHVNSVVDTSGEGTARFLDLAVVLPEGRFQVWKVFAKSDEDLARLAALHAVGARVRLRRDPKTVDLFVDGHLPDSNAGWLIAVSLGLAAIGVAAWFGAFQAFAPQG